MCPYVPLFVLYSAFSCCITHHKAVVLLRKYKAIILNVPLKHNVCVCSFSSTDGGSPLALQHVAQSNTLFTGFFSLLLFHLFIKCLFKRKKKLNLTTSRNCGYNIKPLLRFLPQRLQRFWRVHFMVNAGASTKRKMSRKYKNDAYAASLGAAQKKKNYIHFWRACKSQYVPYASCKCQWRQ